MDARSITRRGMLGTAAASLAFGSRRGLAQGTPRRGGSLIVGIDNNPPALSILASSATLTNCPTGQIFDTLIKLTSDNRLVPGLARSWALAADGLSCTLQLETGVTWHDGAPFSADDVRFSLLELNRVYNAQARGALAGVADIEAPNPATVVIRLKEPDPAFFPWALSQPELAQIHPRHIYQNTDVRANPANRRPIGTGAFRFKEWQSGSHITLERNPDYFHRDAVLLDRVVFQIIPDAGARQVALERGDIDHIPYFCLAPESLDGLSGNRAIRIVDSARPARGQIMAYVNLRHEQLAKKAVRQALSYAIDRELLVQLVLNGRGKASTGPIRSDNPPFYTGEVQRYPRNVAMANRLLDGAGAPRRGGGIRFPLRLSYQSSGEGGALQSAAEVMREQMKEVGIDLRLMPSDIGTVMDAAFMQWNFDLTMGSYFTGPDPKIAVSPKYHSGNVKRLLGANLMGYANPRVDALLDAADREMDLPKRAQLYQQAQVLLVEDVPTLWLWEKTYPLAVRSGLLGLPSGAMHWEPYENVGWAA